MAYNNLGNAWYRKGEINKAKMAFNQALMINPQCQEAKNNLNKIRPVIAKYGGLIDRLKTAVKKEPGNAQLVFQLGQVSEAAGMIDQAIAAYQQARSLAPDSLDCLFVLGNSYAAAGRIKAAAEIFEQLSRKIPDNPTVFYNLACMYARLNHTDKAVAMLKEAVKRGYNRWDNLKTDKDLENIRHTVYYKSLTALE